MYKLAFAVDADGARIVRADEVQAHVQSAGRDGGVARFGLLADARGRPLAFVRAHRRRVEEGRECDVQAHFRRYDERHGGADGPADEDEADESDPSDDGGEAREPIRSAQRPTRRHVDSDACLEALRLLQAHVGRWSVVRWCCPRRERASRWTPPPDCVVRIHAAYSLPGVGYGTARAAAAVYADEADETPVLAVDLSRTPNARHRMAPFAHCRLNARAVVDAFAEQGGEGEQGTPVVDLCDVDEPGAAPCADCLREDARAMQIETCRGRIGKKCIMEACGVGLRVPVVPDDELVVHGCMVYHNGLLTGEKHAQRVVGRLSASDAARVPAGWTPRLFVRTPHPTHVPVVLHWTPP